MMVFAIPLFLQGSEMIALAVGLLFVLAIFEKGWLGGGDAQLAFGLIALARDWLMIMYLLGGTILLAAIMVTRDRGFQGAVKRLRWVITNLDSPYEEAIRIPWALIAAVGAIVHFWLFPGVMWR